MIYSLLEKIQDEGRLVLATILRTEGHTYKKRADCALFVVGEPFPVYGNLGSLCVDQEILSAAKKAWATKKPSILTIDTRDQTDIELGYGTYCGGTMDLLIEPLLDDHKVIYGRIESRLRGGNSVCLLHELATGRLELLDTDPGSEEGRFVEEFHPPHKLIVSGATPLALRVVHHVANMDFDVHVTDWRQAHLDRFASVQGVTPHLDAPPLETDSYVLLLSHSYAHDMEFLEKALRAGCRYIGLLSSRQRRDHMFNELEKRGIARSELQKVCSPVGIEIGARTDEEIAVSIVAEITRNIRQ